MNMWVLTALVADKVKEMHGTQVTGLAGWTLAYFPDEGVAQEFHDWIIQQEIDAKAGGTRHITSQGVRQENDQYMVRFR